MSEDFDLTKLFLGGVLNDEELHGLEGLGFNPAEGLTGGDSSKPQTTVRKGKQGRQGRRGKLFQDDSEEENSEEDMSEEEKTEEAEPRDSYMPSVLYRGANGQTVYTMSEVFVPPKNPTDPHRVNMIRYNQKLMFADLAKKLPRITLAQRRERRRDIKLREKEGIVATKQYMQSEAAVQTAIGDYAFLKTAGKRQRKLEACVEQILPARKTKATESAHASSNGRNAHTALPFDSLELSPVSDPSAKLQWNVSEANVNELAKKFIKPAKTHPRLRPHAVASSPDEARCTLSEMSIDERKACSRQIRIQAEAQIDKVLPRASQIKLNNVEKQCFMFMRRFQGGEVREWPDESVQNAPSGMAGNFRFRSPQRVHPMNQNSITDFLSGQKMTLFGSALSDDELINSSQSAKEDNTFAGMAPQGSTEFANEPSRIGAHERAELRLPREELPSNVQICKWMEEACTDGDGERPKKYWGEALTCPSRHQIAKDYITAKRRAAPTAQASRGNVFRIINDGDQDEESFQSEEERIQEIKQKVWYENQASDVEGVVQATKEIWDRVHRRDENRDLHHTQMLVDQGGSGGVDPYLFQAKPVLFNESLDWQFNKRRTEIYLEKQQQYLQAQQQNSVSSSKAKEAQQPGTTDGQESRSSQPRDDSLKQDQMEFEANAVPQRVNELNHAKCASNLQFTVFEWSQKELRRFHRPDVGSCFDLVRAQDELLRKQQSKQPVLNITSGGVTLFQGSKGGASAIPAFPTLPLRLAVAQDRGESSKGRRGLLNSDQYFKEKSKLSLRKGDFCLFEHFDRDPLFINNFGMATKLKRYVYSEARQLDQVILDKVPCLGPHGQSVPRRGTQNLPLIGQIRDSEYRGLAVIENRLYQAPVFYTQYNKYPNYSQYFLCSVNISKKPGAAADGNPAQPAPCQIFIRPLPELYSVAQQEPKREVLNPYGRSWQNFNRQKAQTYIYRFLQDSRFVSFDEAFKQFPQFGEQGLKKLLKEAGIEVDREQNLYTVTSWNEQDQNEDSAGKKDQPGLFSQLSLEQVCQFESALRGQLAYSKLGMKHAKHLPMDKMSAAANRFCVDEKSRAIRQVCRQIEDKVLTSPWNLATSFINARQQNAMMLLEGLGDPSGGTGGYSFLKMPLKVQSDQCLVKAKSSRAIINPAIKNPKSVSGTDADLRRQTKRSTRAMLIQHGFNEKALAQCGRWKMVSLLKEISGQEPSPDAADNAFENLKFARGERLTTKMQREVYQQKVNSIFRKQIDYHRSDKLQEEADLSDSDPEVLEGKSHASESFEKNSCIFYDGSLRDVRNLASIPGYQKLLVSKIQDEKKIGEDQDPEPLIDELLANRDIDLRCTILRRKIRSLVDGSVTVVYTSDPKLIKKFLKRKKLKGRPPSKQRAQQQSIISLAQMSRLKGLTHGPTSAQNTNLVEIANRGLQPAAGVVSIPNAPSKITLSSMGMGNSTSLVKLSSLKTQTADPQGKVSIKISLNGREVANRPITVRQAPTEAQPPENTHMLEVKPHRVPKLTQPRASQGDKRPHSRSKSSSRGHSKSKKKSKFTLQPSGEGDSSDDAYLSGDTSRKEQTLKRRGQQTHSGVLNQIIEDIVDACIRRDTHRIFHQKVKVKDAPGYFEMVKEPIDFSTMKSKAKRRVYRDEQMIKDDLALLRSNAELYNGHGHLVAQIARDLEEVALKRLKDKHGEILSAFETEI